MGYQEANELLKTIPKEYKKVVLKIAAHYYEEGANVVKNLIDDITNIPTKDLKDYGVWHEDSIDGG